MLTALELKLKTKEKMIWGLSSGSCWGWRERGEDRSAKKTENEGWQVERKPLGKWMVLEAKEGKNISRGWWSTELEIIDTEWVRAMIVPLTW